MNWIRLLRGLAAAVRQRRTKMLEPGEAAPDFAVRSHLDETVRLADLRGRHVVLWFYPKADTPG
jgi:peroxiredoxin